MPKRREGELERRETLEEIRDDVREHLRQFRELVTDPAFNRALEWSKHFDALKADVVNHARGLERRVSTLEDHPGATARELTASNRELATAIRTLARIVRRIDRER